MALLFTITYIADMFCDVIDEIIDKEIDRDKDDQGYLDYRGLRGIRDELMNYKTGNSSSPVSIDQLQFYDANGKVITCAQAKEFVGGLYAEAAQKDKPRSGLIQAYSALSALELLDDTAMQKEIQSVKDHIISTTHVDNAAVLASTNRIFNEMVTASKITAISTAITALKTVLS